MLASAFISLLSYLWMERKISSNCKPRIPKIPAPRHKMKGYRYLEEENSDESGSEEGNESGESERSGSEAENDEEEQPARARRRRRKEENCYEQAVEEEN